MRDNTRAGGALRLSTGQSLPDLRIVPRAEVHLHEETDPARVQRLVARMRADGILRNPPIAAPLPEGGYVVLDGANRSTALMAFEAPLLLVQVVDYHDPAVRLDVWHHLLTEPVDLGALLRSKGLILKDMSVSDAARALAQRAIACYLLGPAGARSVAAAPAQPSAAVLSSVVDAYKATTRIYRVMDTDLDTLARAYGSVSAVVVFPTFTKRDILEIARSPVKLPAGITRHLIPGRALRVNLPLEVLTSPGDAEQKNRWLVEEIHQRLLENRVRYYPEDSFLFDE